MKAPPARCPHRCGAEWDSPPDEAGRDEILTRTAIVGAELAVHLRTVHGDEVRAGRLEALVARMAGA